MTRNSKTLNDVNLEAVSTLVEAIREQPDNADTEWQATVEWKGGFRSEARIRDFDPIPSDEPAALGGDDNAPNPVEQVLAALGNCLAVGYASNASAAGIELKALQVDVAGNVDLHTFLGLTEQHAGYQTIQAKVSIESDATEEEINRLHEKVVSTSPVGHTLQQPIPVDISLI